MLFTQSSHSFITVHSLRGRSTLALLSILGLFGIAPSWASKVIEADDSRSFALQDRALHWQAEPCGRDGRLYHSPEGAHLEGTGNSAAIPLRSYVIALPSNQIPEVSLEVLAERSLDLVCFGEEVDGDSLQKFEGFPAPENGSARLSTPVFRDGAWLITVQVPLVRGQGVSWRGLEHWRLVFRYSGVRTTQQGRAGKRLLARVVNPAGARSFAQSTPQPRRVLTRQTPTAQQWVARISVGDRDHASMSEDGFYAISYGDLRRALLAQGRERDLEGVPVGNLRLRAGSPDTVTHRLLAGTPLPGQHWEIPIQIIDRNGAGDPTPNGIFDEGDTLVFFGQGTSFWKRTDLLDVGAAATMPYFFTSNPFSFSNHYYLAVVPGGDGERLIESQPIAGTPQEITQLARYLRNEKDLMLRDSYFGLLSTGWEDKSGREWFWVWGGNADTTVVSESVLQNARFADLPGLVGTSALWALDLQPHRSAYATINTLDIPVQVGNTQASGASYQYRMSTIRAHLFVNGNRADSTGVLLPGAGFVREAPVQATGNRLRVEMYPNGRHYDRFDGVTLAYTWNPQAIEGGEWLLPGALAGRVRVRLQGNTQNLRVLRVENHRSTAWLPIENGTFTDSIDPGLDVRWFLCDARERKGGWAVEAFVPPSAGVLQDLSNLREDGTEYLVIVPDDMVAEAIQLKEFRQSGAAILPLRTQVVRAGDIWREYSGGRPEPAALRDFIRYARSRWADLRFVLLAGDGHFDYRALRSRTGPNPLPPYQFEDISTDDFFQVLDSGESIHYGAYDRDIAIGRLPVNSAQQFRAYLEKMRNHEELSRRDNSDWRNALILSADDWFQRGAEDLVKDHQRHTESIANVLDSMAANRDFQLDIKKLYLFSYKADLSWQKPEATRDLLALMNQGAVFTIYYGHGSSTDWADEGLLRPSSLPQLSNARRLTILGSFACTVGRFDEGDGSSLSELFLIQQPAGAIVSIGAMRESLSISNRDLGLEIMRQSYFNPDISTIGEAFLAAKTSGFSWSSRRYNDERYVLLGEPVISLPRASIQVHFDQTLDTLQALQRVRLSGRVSGGAAQGMVHIQVRQGPQQRIMQESFGNISFTETARIQGPVIYEERIPFQNGRFNTEFISPRKLEFGDTSAQVRAWAWVPGQRSAGRGLLKDIVIHGTSSYADSIQDDQAPDIRLRQCGLPDSARGQYFSSGQIIRLRIPGCLEVVITDSTGLDIRTEADEGISFEIPGIESPWHPQPFLEQTGKRVVARMNFTSGYEAGQYLFRVRAQDILGNVGVREESVQLSGELTHGLADVYNAPNPMGRRGTVFYFKNLADGQRSVGTIRIFDQSGRIVRVLRDVQSGITHWNGRDQWGRPLANGLYHYEVALVSFADAGSGGKTRTWTARQKLVISR